MGRLVRDQREAKPTATALLGCKMCPIKWQLGAFVRHWARAEGKIWNFYVEKKCFFPLIITTEGNVAVLKLILAPNGG